MKGQRTPLQCRCYRVADNVNAVMRLDDWSCRLRYRYRLQLMSGQCFDDRAGYALRLVHRQTPDASARVHPRQIDQLGFNCADVLRDAADRAAWNRLVSQELCTSRAKSQAPVPAL